MVNVATARALLGESGLLNAPDVKVRANNSVAKN